MIIENACSEHRCNCLQPELWGMIWFDPNVDYLCVNCGHEDSKHNRVVRY